MPLTIAISACLLGIPCRYDGRAKPREAALRLAELPGVAVVPVCPEQAGGLPTPRTPGEIVRTATGRRVVDREGVDRTEAFELGAQKTLELALSSGCKLAVLKAKSPSCGTGLVYDGSFTGAMATGNGIAAQLLLDNGIPVIDEQQLEALWKAAESDEKRVDANSSCTPSASTRRPHDQPRRNAKP